MLSQATFKLISFELTKELELNYYFEAAALLEAYQLLKHYQVPLVRLEEFWDEPSKKLIRFSEKLQDFLNAEVLSLPAFSWQSSAQTLKKAPLGLLLFNLLELKHQAGLESISSVFTTPFIREHLPRRHYLDFKIRQQTHSYIDLKAYVSKLEDFQEWHHFADAALPDQASLAEWVALSKNFWQILNVQIPDQVMTALDEYFMSANEYVKPHPYSEFLQHFNMYLEDTHFPLADQYLAFKIYHNTFIPARLKNEFIIRWPDISAQEMEAPSIAYGGGQKPYAKAKAHQILANPNALKLREQAGGAAILSQQAACPFKAFAHFQLKLTTLVQNEVWLSQKLKGIAIHRILEKIWDGLKTQQKLLSLTEEALNQLVHETTVNVVFGLSHNTQFFLPASLAQLEVRRLMQLILAWLAEEKRRPEFKISTLESQSLAYLGDLVIKLRLDRIDELADGSRLVIDYKTGSVNLKDWLSEPLGDVQLPLYVLTTSAAGALFAEVNNNLHFSGIIDAEIAPFSEVKAAEQVAHRSWEDLKSFWRTHIHKLAHEITKGIAYVAPTQGACDYCDLHSLCRIRENLS